MADNSSKIEFINGNIYACIVTLDICNRVNLKHIIELIVDKHNINIGIQDENSPFIQLIIEQYTIGASWRLIPATVLKRNRTFTTFSPVKSKPIREHVVDMKFDRIMSYIKSNRSKIGNEYTLTETNIPVKGNKCNVIYNLISSRDIELRKIVLDAIVEEYLEMPSEKIVDAIVDYCINKYGIIKKL
jgi:hypothetical protein